MFDFVLEYGFTFFQSFLGLELAFILKVSFFFLCP